MGTISLEDICLPERYSDFESYEESVKLGPSPTHLCGVAVTASGGPQITASAASSSASEAHRRASWELLERIAVYEHLSKAPANHSAERWALSRSNGVALFSDVKGAEARARLELLERHHVLKHWFLARAPRALPSASLEIPGYTLHAFLFNEGPSVVGVFAFPVDHSRPLVFGFGAHEREATALEKANSETLQRLGFLHDEPLPAELPEFEPTALYHQEFYLYPENAKVLSEWLAGDLYEAGRTPVVDEYNEDLSAIEYLNITPSYFEERAVVVKATSSAHIPLVFGRYPQWDSLLPNKLQVHPIA